MRAVLLHLITTAEWRSVLAVGAVTPLPEVGFVHLSAVDQVALPANRLFAGRNDVLLLVLDPDRLGVEVRWEPGVPGDPESMRFPHAYGPVPVSAVVAVEPYRPGADGFAEPRLPEFDTATRALRLEMSVTRRMATTEVPVTGGVAVRTPAVAGSRQHNQLLIDGPTDAATIVAEADRVLAGYDRRMATLLGAGQAGTAKALADLGWEVDEVAVMAAPAGGTRDARVELVDVDALRPSWAENRRRSVPGIRDAVITDLAERYVLQQQVVDNRYLAVRDGDRVLASALLSVDGATAWLNDVMTDPAHRRRGHGEALLDTALALADEAGCDLVGLGAVADDWPLTWYARRGFVDVERCWCATSVR
ncbi:GNAT family N-acetyltransferase [Pseudonocardia sp. CA-107938]|uniref:GNAT family N-acetyltransferase n=1 Tax=Pseudonocardia sp. CA-107938 TaxID=3240021 RepID=UPI003D94F44B